MTTAFGQILWSPNRIQAKQYTSYRLQSYILCKYQARMIWYDLTGSNWQLQHAFEQQQQQHNDYDDDYIDTKNKYTNNYK